MPIDWTDKYFKYTEKMFRDICDDFNLKSGDISPEDDLSIFLIIDRFIDNNRGDKESDG
jgi:hypothetical protein